MKYQRPRAAEQNHIRLETLGNAIDIIVDYIVNLPIFDLYDLNNK